MKISQSNHCRILSHQYIQWNIITYQYQYLQFLSRNIRNHHPFQVLYLKCSYLRLVKQYAMLNMGISINSLKRHSTFISRHYNKPGGRSTKIQQEIPKHIISIMLILLPGTVTNPHPLQRDIPPGCTLPDADDLQNEVSWTNCSQPCSQFQSLHFPPQYPSQKVSATVQYINRGPFVEIPCKCMVTFYLRNIRTRWTCKKNPWVPHWCGETFGEQTMDNTSTCQQTLFQQWNTGVLAVLHCGV